MVSVIRGAAMASWYSNNEVSNSFDDGIGYRGRKIMI
jgi:hypothetical protein